MLKLPDFFLILDFPVLLPGADRDGPAGHCRLRGGVHLAPRAGGGRGAAGPGGGQRRHRRAGAVAVPEPSAVRRAQQPVRFLKTDSPSPAGPPAGVFLKKALQNTLGGYIMASECQIPPRGMEGK